MTPTIEQRIEALERQNRRLKLVGGATIGIVLLALAAGQATSKKAEPPASKGRIIEAEGFILRDKNGLTRAGLTLVDDVVHFAVYDKKGKPRLDLYGGKDVQVLSFYGTSNEPRMMLGATKDGQALSFYGTNNEPRMRLSALPPGPIINFYDTNNKSRMMLYASKDGPALSLSDAKGRSRAVLGVSSQENTRTGTVTNRPESSLVLYGKEGKVVWKAPQD